MKSVLLFLTILFLGNTVVAQDVPQNVTATWAAFDPRAEPLEVEVLRTWSEDDIKLQHVRYVVGTFRGKKTRVAAFFARPKDGKQLPGIVQVHGGGQRALTETVKFWASHGYAAIAVNWGEHPIGETGALNTDWMGIAAGFHDPKHHNDVSSGKGTLYDTPHPWNSSWLLYAAAARRAITFLERRPNVDGDRIGITGHSMGGRITVLTAIDPRVKAASPSVGGSGSLYEDIRGVPRSARRMMADVHLYKRTIDCKSYWPLIRCPLLFLGATNDFNSPMEKVIDGFQSLPQPGGALAFAPHKNHRFTADTYAARVRWFQSHLKHDFQFPELATSQLVLKTSDGIPRFRVQPDVSVPYKLKSVAIYYGFARDPRTRFWRAADVAKVDGSYEALCPVMELDEPLFAFANITYDTGKTLQMPRGFEPTSLLTVASEVRQAFPQQMQQSGVKANGQRQRLIDDFSAGWRDWSQVGVRHREHWNYTTHKINDPAFFGPRGADLVFDIETTAAGDTLAVVMETDKWRGYTRRKTEHYTALVTLPKVGKQTVRLATTSFVSPDGKPLANYDRVSGLILTPGDKEKPETVKSHWQGTVPTFANLRWERGTFDPRPKPYLP